MKGLFCNSTLSNSTYTLDNGSVLWIQLVMAVLSIVGSGSIIVFALFQNLLGSRKVRALFFLSLADLLICFTWLVGVVLLNQTCNGHAACYNLHAVEQIFYLASFFYTLNYTWVLYVHLKEDYCRNMTGQSTLQFPGRTCPLTKITGVLSCVFPVLLMVPVFVVGNLNSCSRNLSKSYECLLMHTWVLYKPCGSLETTSCHHIHAYSIAIFITTFVLSLSGILVLMAKARSMYRRCVASDDGLLDARGWTSLRLLQRQMLLYSSAFAVCWFPALLLAILTLFNVQEGHLLYVILYMLQAFTSPSQGWINCLLCGWTQQRFHFLKTMEQRDADTQTPLLRSQKQKSYGAQCE
ncbi:hypothetical protein SKAU_G00356010 [Synaphobranchus kaupii]|uniref:G-protein coupled receptors family 1 profile domain-containing protein n=1 Tax=Synaphobranchus kaupii TaxID=118154 RepID=A0A9Q1EHF1_SYNKA|nr:hypothetical protein SKAU_G00356010 [Synaphobranchus kaupii]